MVDEFNQSSNKRRLQTDQTWTLTFSHQVEVRHQGRAERIRVDETGHIIGGQDSENTCNSYDYDGAFTCAK